jgi:hypothetical protein
LLGLDWKDQFGWAICSAFINLTFCCFRGGFCNRFVGFLMEFFEGLVRWKLKFPAKIP